MIERLAVFVLSCCAMLSASEIKGTIKNVAGGEALDQVKVTLLEAGREAVTGADGTFVLQELAAGSYTLRLTAVGYRVTTISFSLGAAEIKEFDLLLVPDNFRHTETMRVTGDVFQAEDSPAVSENNLTVSEIREASTVFADDPFRAIQALPGVSAPANNEFYAQFSVMGAPFSSVSVYLDDVLTSPFHDIPEITQGASLSLLTSETVQDIKLMPVAFPVKYADSVGAALDIHTRDGSRSAPLFRVSVGIADSDFLGEGDLGSARHGSWIASARKSYIGYLIRNRENDVENVSFYDGDVKLSYDLTAKQSVSFHALGGQTYTQLDSSPDPNAFVTGDSSVTFVRTGWRWSAAPDLLVDAHAAYLSEPHDSHNTSGTILDTYAYGEWVAGSNLTWAWKNNDVLEGGATLRRLRDDGYAAYFQNINPTFLSIAQGTGLRGDVYLQQSSSLLKNKLHVMGGIRWDGLQRIGVHPFSEQASAALRVLRATELQLGVGRYAQFPDFQQVATPTCEPFGNLLERSDHFTAAIEQRFGESTRFRVQGFDRQDANIVGTPTGYPGLSPVTITGPCGALVAVPGNSTYQRDYSRGVQFVLQRRSANRLSGWVGYTLTYARQREYEVMLPLSPFAAIQFSSDTSYFSSLLDQRHSLNAFGSYRVRPSVNLSGKMIYGSGFPVPSGTFVQLGNTYEEIGLNAARLPAYVRFDLRCDKSWAFKKEKLTLYGEVLNATNHDNRIYAYTTGVNPSTGKSTILTEEELPITPTAGVVVEF